MPAGQASKVGIDEQKRIATKLDALANKTQRLETLYQQKQAALTAIKEAAAPPGLQRSPVSRLTHNLTDTLLIL